MASSIFLDTNGWLALLNATDALHQQVDQAWKNIGAGSDRITDAFTSDHHFEQAGFHCLLTA